MAMKKFINDPANLTSELLDGLVQCYPNQLALKNDRIVVRANPKPADKVADVQAAVDEAVAAGAAVLLPKYSLGGTCAIAYVGYKNGPQVEFFQD